MTVAQAQQQALTISQWWYDSLTLPERVRHEIALATYLTAYSLFMAGTSLNEIYAAVFSANVKVMNNACK